MIRQIPCVCVAILSVTFSCLDMTGEDPKTATVHLRIVDQAVGHDLGVAMVESFQRKYSDVPSQDFGGRFYKNTANKIPYDFYELCAHRKTYRPSCTEVDVSQPEVWVVLGLRLGHLTPGRNSLEGSIAGVTPGKSDLWVRLVGLYSGFAVDAKVDQSGKFRTSGAVGKYVLVVVQNDRILHTQAISIPANGPVRIELPGGK